MKKLKKLTKEEKKQIRANAKQKGVSIISEFKKFILRGNVVDMAVGVIVASAFTTIINSITNSIFMPLINFLINLVYGNNDFSEIKTVLRQASFDSEGVEIVSEIAIKWGVVIEAILNFLLIAIFIFATIKLLNYLKNKYIYLKEKLSKQEPVKEEEEKEPTTNELLAEIVELLKNKEEEEKKE